MVMIGFGSSASKATTGKRSIVGVGDMGISDDLSVTISTFALGSCVGVVAFDPIKKIGGILHVMLPDSSISEEKAKLQPFLFADSGMDKFRSELLAAGVNDDNLNVVLAGGASVMVDNDLFKIGEQNTSAVKSKIAEFGWNIVAEQLGGLTNRSLHFEMKRNQLLINLPDQKMEVDLS